MIKFHAKQVIPYQHTINYKLMAESHDSAREMVRNNSGENKFVDLDIIKLNITGTKKEQIIKKYITDQYCG